MQPRAGSHGGFCFTPPAPLSQGPLCSGQPLQWYVFAQFPPTSSAQKYEKDELLGRRLCGAGRNNFEIVKKCHDSSCTHLSFYVFSIDY